MNTIHYGANALTHLCTQVVVVVGRDKCLNALTVFHINFGIHRILELLVSTLVQRIGTLHRMERIASYSGCVDHVTGSNISIMNLCIGMWARLQCILMNSCC